MKDSGLNNIFPIELYRLSLTCKYFYKLTYDKDLWREAIFDINAYIIHPRMFPLHSIRLIMKEEGKSDSTLLKNAITNLPHSLRELNLQFCGLENPDREDFYLSSLSTLPQLEILHLGNNAGCPEDIIDADFSHIATCEHLRVLHLSSLNKVTLAGLRSLAPLAKLEILYLCWLPDIISKDIEVSLPQVQELHINGKKLYGKEEGIQRRPKRIKRTAFSID